MIRKMFEQLQNREEELFYKSIRGEATKEDHENARAALIAFYNEHKNEL